mgnify:CR=1 FL=1
MNKTDKLEYIIQNTCFENIADIFDLMMLNFDEVSDGLYKVLDIDYIEPEDDESDSEWANRVKDSEYAIVESFCSCCKKKNTQQVIDIAREKGKLIDLFKYIIGDNISNIIEFKRMLNEDSTNYELISTVEDILYTLESEDF